MKTSIVSATLGYIQEKKMSMTKTRVVLLVLWMLIELESTVIDDDVAILVTSIASSSRSNSRTTNRPSTTRNSIPRHPFLYKKDYKDWLGLKTGTVRSCGAFHPSLSQPSHRVCCHQETSSASFVSRSLTYKISSRKDEITNFILKKEK